MKGERQAEPDCSDRAFAALRSRSREQGLLARRCPLPTVPLKERGREHPHLQDNGKQHVGVGLPIGRGVADDADLGRARLYRLLAALLARPPEQDLLARLSGLADDGTTIGSALAGLAGAADSATPEGVEREFFDLFIGIGRGELLPYASYYLTGFLHERPLARLRGDLARLGVARAEGVAEPEDHIATLCEVMAGLIDGTFPAPAGEDGRFFERHLRPWAERFFADLEGAKAARFYRAVGRLGGRFLAIETEALALPA